MNRVMPSGRGAVSTPPWTTEDWLRHERQRAERFNRSEGKLSGYDCPICRNRGSFARVADNGSMVFRRCTCMNVRDAQQAMRASGVPDNVLDHCTFDGWETPHDWQKMALTLAKRYTEEAGDREAFHSWFIMCGRPGSGKTRLCTTVFRAMLEKGYWGQYISWRDFARQAKSSVNDRDAFSKLTDGAKKAQLVYIDDFWKGSVTPGDVHLTFEIINERYCAGKPTILSSECSLEAIVRGDEAIGSRIGEMCEGFYVDCSKAENWRKHAAAKHKYA